MHRYWVWLATRPALSEEQKLTLLKHFRTPEDLYFANEPGKEVSLTEKAQSCLADRDLAGAEEILRRCRQLDIGLLTFDDPLYPQRLRQLPDAPILLYYKGKLPTFDRLPVIGVVGTRKASPYGLEMASLLGGQIAACGGLVVSGMAAGIDGCATAAALQACGTAVGVLGCGVDRIFPASNKALFEQMEECGCLISEYPPGAFPQKWMFPRRNRIISGLSCGVLVVEAPERSGALITAGLAAEQMRDVFVVPGNVGVESCAGSNALMRKGAIVATSGWDVVGEYEYQFPNVIEKRDYVPGKLPQKEAPVPPVAKKNVPAQDPVSQPKPAPNVEKYADILTSQQKLVLEALEGGERLIDDLILQTGLSSQEVLSAVTMMEIRGIVQSLPGHRVAIQ